MSNEIHYSERLPRYVFNGGMKNRSSILIFQWSIRLFVLFIIFAMVNGFLIQKALGSSFVDYIGLLCALIASSVLLRNTEIVMQRALNGNVALKISEDTISSIEPYHRIFNRKLLLKRTNIDHIEIVRGNGQQRLGQKEIIIWFDSMVGFKIVDNNGRKFDVGYKPPMVIKEMTDLMRDRWGIPIKDDGSGMGHGKRYSQGKILWDLPYDDIMKMDPFEWQE